ncbi:MAG TPA: O-antigen polymerase [Steroidobacteraceae bacterium]|nr:O-antigen polymerase [Steroidobacteraceae bacterium]
MDGSDIRRLRGSIIAHPVCVFAGVWTLAFLLYGLHLSELLIFDATGFAYLYAAIVGSFLAGYFYASALFFGLSRGASSGTEVMGFGFTDLMADEVEVIWKRVKTLFWIWALLTVVEVVVSRGVPLMWLFEGVGKDYRDFGIPSVHGVLLSLLLACSMVSYYLHLHSPQRRFIAIPIFAVIWFLICITRGFFVGILLQFLFLYLCVNRIKTSQAVKIGGAILAVIVFFGLVGNLRSGGADLIRAVGQPTARFPTWLPTGFLWVYIYMATPLNNLFNTIQLHVTVDSYTLSTTTAQLFPSFIRNLIFAKESLKQADLVSQNLNVSTEFIGPYLDMGMLGIVVFSLLFGALANVFWSRRSSRASLLGYAFIAQAMALSIFYDILLDLPFLFQLAWFWYILRPVRWRTVAAEGSEGPGGALSQGAAT